MATAAELAMENLLAGYDPASFMPMQTTYDMWLKDQLGAQPLAYAYGASQAPYAQLQYLAQPIGGQDQALNLYAGVQNPFGSFLRNQYGQGSPVWTGSDWGNVASNIYNTLSGVAPSITGGIGAAAQELIRQRFGSGSEEALNRQRQLAFAPIMTGSSPALRGEISNVLGNLYNRWMGAETDRPGSSFLQYALGRDLGAGQRGLWEQFGIQPPATGFAYGGGDMNTWRDTSFRNPDDTE